MNSIVEVYNKIYKKIDSINAKIKAIQDEIESLSQEREENIEARIDNLKETIERIDETMLVIKGFQEHAKNYIDSTNILTIEAPEGYRVNVNRLKNWAALIDPTAKIDPYAQRIYVVAKCDECFLNKKRAEFEEKIEYLSSSNSNLLESEIREYNAQINEFKKSLCEVVESQEMDDFVKSLIELNQQYWKNDAPNEIVEKSTDKIALGAVSLPLPVGDENTLSMTQKLNHFFDAKTKRVLVPYELSDDKEFVVTTSCIPSKSKQLERGIQNYILNCLSKKPGSQKIYILDASRYNTSSLGNLKQLEDTYLLAKIPRNPEQLTSTLELLVSKFMDYDDKIDAYDSLREYNENKPQDALANTLLILYGWPNSFSNNDRDLVNKIIMNYERYGVSLIAISYSAMKKDKYSQEQSFELPEYAESNAINITMKNKETLISEPEGSSVPFMWYLYNGELQKDLIDKIKSIKVDEAKKGNKYNEWFPLIRSNQLEEYKRDYKKLELPFGINAKDKINSLSFEDENFAAYLVGASRSGKSTLIHTLIAGIIRNYHPDNVELWLADFKQLEFESYIKNTPPHVKYVLLDESTELVYDLIDKLTEVMMERQYLFSRLGKNNINEINPATLSAPLPIILVILDEFSIMSQKLENSDIYKIKLQNLLAKGGALGIKFIFSSQTFTTGVSGLTSTARAQIQQRIAMKSSASEIDSVLELSSNLKTDQVRNWISAFPPHYALVKYKPNEDTILVDKYHVLYFDDYSLRDNMIKEINASMKCVDTYIPEDISTYVDKRPVLVDGKEYIAYTDKLLKDAIKEELSTHPDDYSGDDIFVMFGKPRLMTSTKLVPITNESRENILLIANSMEQNCASSIIESTMKAFKSQNAKVSIWTYAKNKLYNANKSKTWNNIEYSISNTQDKICDSIREMRQKIQNGEQGNELIVLLGFERICSEFEFASGGSINRDDDIKTLEELTNQKQAKELNNKAVVTDKLKQLQKPIDVMYMLLIKSICDMQKVDGEERQKLKKELFNKITQEDFYNEPKKCYEDYNITISNEELNKLLKNIDTYFDYAETLDEEDEIAGDEAKDDNAVTEKSADIGTYNALDDLLFIIKYGSRLGYHFMMVLNNCSDLKQTNVKLDMFRHRLAFQINKEDSYNFMGNRSASAIPEHVCQYYDTLNHFSFRPYIHSNIGWEGWYVDENGKAKNNYR